MRFQLPVGSNSQDKFCKTVINVYPLNLITSLAQEEPFPHTEVNLKRKLLLSIFSSCGGFFFQSFYPLPERDT